jgi:hypothetical protein
MKRSRLFIYSIILLVFMLIISLIVFFYQQRQPPVATTNTVIINPATSMGTIPREFPGLGLEPFSICTLESLDKKGPELVNIFKNLGPAILRFGGNTVESTGWSSRGISSCSYR